MGKAAWLGARHRVEQALDFRVQIFGDRERRWAAVRSERALHGIIRKVHAVHAPISSARLYWENKTVFFAPLNVSIPVAVSAFPDELYQVPRSWAERAFPKLIHYNRLEKGGHFAAWEQPELFSFGGPGGTLTLGRVTRATFAVRSIRPEPVAAMVAPAIFMTSSGPSDRHTARTRALHCSAVEIHTTLVSISFKIALVRGISRHCPHGLVSHALHRPTPSACASRSSARNSWTRCSPSGGM